MALPDQHGPLPAPPAGLHARTLPLVHAQRSWIRLHTCVHEPLFFGRTGRGRFDAAQQEYGVLYAGSDAHCAFIETYGWETGVRFVTAQELASRCLATIATDRPLALVDLTGPGLAQIGCDARLFAGAHADAQRWALALWSHPAQPDGLLYPARHDPSRQAVAIFDRAATAVAATCGLSLIDPSNATVLAAILDTYRFSLI